MCFYHINCCCPTVADDMVLISFSKAALEKMLRICLEYALKWGYEYNAIKRPVIVFNETLSNQLLPSRIRELGEQEVPETSQYKHLGITIERDMTLNTVTKEASTKLKTTFLSLVNCGLHEDGFTPPLQPSTFINRLCCLNPYMAARYGRNCPLFSSQH